MLPHGGGGGKNGGWNCHLPWNPTERSHKLLSQRFALISSAEVINSLWTHCNWRSRTREMTTWPHRQYRRNTPADPVHKMYGFVIFVGFTYTYFRWSFLEIQRNGEKRQTAPSCDRWSFCLLPVNGGSIFKQEIKFTICTPYLRFRLIMVLISLHQTCSF